MSYSKLNRTALVSALSLALFAPLDALAQDQEQTQEEGTRQEGQTQETAAQQPPQAADAAAQDGTKTLEKVSVTGSRIKRTDLEGPSPVTVITADQIKKEGHATVFEALTTLPEVTGTVARGVGWGQATVNAYPLNLRNLGPGRTLLLINGRRVADYPMPYQGRSNFANFNNIPTGIVERIEVLSGSASAIYGSDAVAGVVNVILKDDVDGDTFRARYNMTERGGREGREFTGSGGKSGDKWSISYTAQYFDRKPLFGGDRDFINSELDKPYESWGPRDRHFGTGWRQPVYGAALRDLDNRVNGVAYHLAPPAGACERFGGEWYTWQLQDYNRNTGQEFDQGTYCASNIGDRWTFEPGTRDFSAYLYGTYDFDNGMQAWASYGAWDSLGESNTFLNAFGIDFWDPRANGGAGGARQYRKRFSPMEQGGTSRIMTRSSEFAFDFATGLRGTMFDGRYDWEASAGHAEYAIEERFPSINESAAAEFLMGPQEGTTAGGLPIYRPDYDLLWSPITQSQYREFGVVGTKKARSWLTQAAVTFSGDLFEGWAGPIGFASTLEAAKQGYRLTPDPNTVGSDPVYFTPFGNVEQGGGERKRYAAGVEFKVPLLKSLTLSAAGRYDRYDAVADDAATSWNAGLEWRPFSSLLVRGSKSTSFRAPDMHFVFAAPSVSVFDETDILRCVQDPNRQPGSGCPGGDGSPYHIDNPEIARQGTPDLLYETGDSETVGFVWDAFKNFSLSVDYYKITIENAVDDIGSSDVLRDEAYCLTGLTPDGAPRSSPPSAALCELQLSRVTRGPDPDGAGPQVGTVSRIEIGPINRAEMAVEGVDVKVNYSLPDTAWGSFRFDLGYTNQLSVKSKQFPGDEFDEQRDDSIRSKATLGVNWQSPGERWNATVFGTRHSGSKDGRYSGGCLSFADGYQPPRFSGEPGEAPTRECYDPLQITVNGQVVANPSPTAGQSTRTHYNRAPDPVFWNGSVGYKLNDKATVNLYVNNLFDKVYRNQYYGDWVYGYGNILGRTWAAEFVYKFD